MDAKYRVDTDICEDAFEYEMNWWIGYFLKEAFVDKINENLVKTEDASKHVFEKIEVDDEKTVDIEICKESFEDEINAND